MSSYQIYKFKITLEVTRKCLGTILRTLSQTYIQTSEYFWSNSIASVGGKLICTEYVVLESTSGDASGFANARLLSFQPPSVHTMHSRPGSWTTWRWQSYKAHVFTMSLAKMAPHATSQYPSDSHEFPNLCFILRNADLCHLPWAHWSWNCCGPEKANMSNWGPCFDLSTLLAHGAWLLSARFYPPFFLWPFLLAKGCSGITLNSNKKLLPRSSKARGTGASRKRPLLRRNGARDFFQVPA